MEYYIHFIKKNKQTKTWTSQKYNLYFLRFNPISSSVFISSQKNNKKQ